MNNWWCYTSLGRPTPARSVPMSARHEPSPWGNFQPLPTPTVLAASAFSPYTPAVPPRFSPIQNCSHLFGNNLPQGDSRTSPTLNNDPTEDSDQSAEKTPLTIHEQPPIESVSTEKAPVESFTLTEDDVILEFDIGNQNKRFCSLVESHLAKFIVAHKGEKSDIVQKIIDETKQRGGRFLKRSKNSLQPVPDEQARRKVFSALRKARRDAQKHRPLFGIRSNASLLNDGAKTSDAQQQRQVPLVNSNETNEATDKKQPTLSTAETIDTMSGQDRTSAYLDPKKRKQRPLVANDIESKPRKKIQASSKPKKASHTHVQGAKESSDGQNLQILTKQKPQVEIQASCQSRKGSQMRAQDESKPSDGQELQIQAKAALKSTETLVSRPPAKRTKWTKPDKNQLPGVRVAVNRMRTNEARYKNQLLGNNPRFIGHFPDRAIALLAGNFVATRFVELKKSRTPEEAFQQAKEESITLYRDGQDPGIISNTETRVTGPQQVALQPADPLMEKVQSRNGELPTTLKGHMKGKNSKADPVSSSIVASRTSKSTPPQEVSTEEAIVDETVRILLQMDAETIESV